MNKEKENLRRQQRKRMEQYKIVPSIDGTIDASKKITDQCILLPEVQEAKSIFIYASMRAEVSTDDLITTLLLQGKKVCVPKILEHSIMIPVEIRSLTELSIERYPFREPQACVPFTYDIDLIIVPGLAFDKVGNRLGYGGGYYDRYFSVSTAIHSVGLAYEWQILGKIPSEVHDHQVDIILTPTKIYR